MARQAIIALTAPSVVLGVAWWLYQHAPTTAWVWLLGILLGAVLQRSRYCIAAAFRDSVLFFDTGPARSVLLAIALSSVTFAVFQAGSPGLPAAIQPVTAGTLVGPFLFGVGMIPAGGCAGSALLRLGEGHLRFLWTLLGLVLGSLLGAYQYGWWEGLLGNAGPVYLPALLGWPGALALQAALLAALFLVLRWWERKGADML